MGDFSEHILFGFLSAAVISYFVKGLLVLQGSETLVSSLGILAGSVLPDIDHKNSYVHRAVKAFTSISAGLSAMFLVPLPVHLRFVISAMTFLGVYTCFSMVKIKHRGFFHSISFAVIFTSIAVIFSVQTFSSVIPGMAFGIGVGSHLLLDGELKIE